MSKIVILFNSWQLFHIQPLKTIHTSRNCASLALTQISLYRYKQFLRDIFFNSFISQEIFYSRITKSFHMHFSCEKTLLEIHMNTQATHLNKYEFLSIKGHTCISTITLTYFSFFFYMYIINC